MHSDRNGGLDLHAYGDYRCWVFFQICSVCLSCLKKCSFKTFAHTSEAIVLLLTSLHILDIITLSEILFTNIQVYGLSLILLLVNRNLSV